MAITTPFGPFEPLSERQQADAADSLHALLNSTAVRFFRLDFSLASIARFDRFLGELGDRIATYPADEHRARAWELARIMAPYVGETVIRIVPRARLGWCCDQLTVRIGIDARNQFIGFVTTRTAKRLQSADGSVSAFVAGVLASERLAARRSSDGG